MSLGVGELGDPVVFSNNFPETHSNEAEVWMELGNEVPETEDNSTTPLALLVSFLPSKEAGCNSRAQ